MITKSEYIVSGKYMGADTFYGLSTDSTKPSNVANGSRLVEMDTSNIYFYDAENAEWLEWGSVVQSDAQGGDT